MTTIDLNQKITDARAKIHSIADEIRVRIHLGEMDLKDTWKAFEPKLLKMEETAHQASEDALKSLHELLAPLEALAAKLKTGKLPS